MSEITFNPFLIGKSVDLVVLDEAIAEHTNWYNWFNDEEVTIHTQHHYYPNTKTEQLEYFRNHIVGNKTKVQFGVVHKKDQKLIGMVSLNNMNFLHRRCEMAIIIGERQYQNLTYATEACHLIIKHAFDNLNMNKVWGGTIREEICLWCCRALGFQKEGIKREEVCKNGQYCDVYLFGMLRDEFYARQRQNKAAHRIKEDHVESI